jgi:uncharacterized phage-associated protein
MTPTRMLLEPRRREGDDAMPERPNDRKMKELILYLAQKSECDAAFGAVKLNKLLFFADFLAFQNFGKSITGHEYQKLKHGPAPRRLLPIQNALENDGSIRIVPTEYHGKTQNRCVAVRDPVMSDFDSEEIALVDQIIAEFSEKNAAFVSDLSHRFAGWKLAEECETIPYVVALVGCRGPTTGEIEAGKALADRAAKCLLEDET